MMSESLAVAAESLAITTKSATAPAIVAFVEGHAAVMRRQHTAERPEPRLLVIGEALVQRSAGVGDLLQRSAGLGHSIGPAGHPLERIALSLGLCVALGVARGIALGILALLRLARFALLHTLDAQLSSVTHGLLERRPILRLVRRQ